MPEVQSDVEAGGESAVLGVLLEGDMRPWSMGELELEIGDRVKTADAVARLYRAGLVHRTSDGFVFATRAAVRYHEIAG